MVTPRTPGWLRAAAALVLTAGLVLPLTTCRFLFATPFPAAMSVAEKVVDLSDVVRAPPDWFRCDDCARLDYLNGYLFLQLNNSQLIVLDPDLNVLGEFPGNHGRLAVYDGGSYHIGNEWYSGPPFNQGISPPYSGWGHARAYYSSPSTCIFWTDWVSPGTLQATGGIPGSVPISSGLHLVDVAYDGLSTVYFIFSSDFDGGAEVLQTTHSMVTDFSNWWITYGDYPFSFARIFLPEADNNRYHVTGDGFILLRGGTYERYNLTTGKLVDELPGMYVRDFADAFDPSGSYFYFYDGGSRKIYKCRTWW